MPSMQCIPAFHGFPHILSAPKIPLLAFLDRGTNERLDPGPVSANEQPAGPFQFTESLQLCEGGRMEEQERSWSHSSTQYQWNAGWGRVGERNFVSGIPGASIILYHILYICIYVFVQSLKDVERNGTS